MTAPAAPPAAPAANVPTLRSLYIDQPAKNGKHGGDRDDDGGRKVDVAHNLVVLNLVCERLHDQ